ncbi:MAG: hypothetical protein WD016_08455 [Balneolaceae bacterium]
MKIYKLLPLVLLASLFLLPQLVQAQYYEDDLKYRKWRVTIFPPLSTNGVEAPNYTAKYSINLIGGYHGGLDGFEIGSLFNYNKFYSHGFQIAGGVNATGGSMAGVNLAGGLNFSDYDMTGIQIAGGVNVSGNNLEGIQAAGLFNIAKGSSSGLQFAGIGNISNNNIEGLQGAGILNAALGDISGLQGAGIANIAKENVEGLQVSGVLNLAGSDMVGLQATGAASIALGNMEGLMMSGGVNIANKEASGLMIAGGLNYARELNGLAISGGANIAEELQGMQIAGLLNVSKKATGLQVGVINLAQEFEGVPIGFFSLYGNGRKNFDVRFSDGGFTDIGLTLGTYRVYNMAVFGYNPLLDRDVYRVGIAVGLEKNIQESFPNMVSNTLYVNQEFSMMHHFEDDWKSRNNKIYSYKFLVGKRFGSGLSLYAGPSLNMQVTREPDAVDYTWYSIWSPSAKGRDYRFWVGFSVGLRLFKQKNMPLFKDEFNGWDIDW